MSILITPKAFNPLLKFVKEVFNNETSDSWGVVGPVAAVALGIATSAEVEYIDIVLCEELYPLVEGNFGSTNGSVLIASLRIKTGPKLSAMAINNRGDLPVFMGKKKARTVKAASIPRKAMASPNCTDSFIDPQTGHMVNHVPRWAMPQQPQHPMQRYPQQMMQNQMPMHPMPPQMMQNQMPMNPMPPQMMQPMPYMPGWAMPQKPESPVVGNRYNNIYRENWMLIDWYANKNKLGVLDAIDIWKYIDNESRVEFEDEFVQELLKGMAEIEKWARTKQGKDSEKDSDNLSKFPEWVKNYLCFKDMYSLVKYWEFASNFSKEELLKNYIAQQKPTQNESEDKFMQAINELKILNAKAKKIGLKQTTQPQEETEK